MALEVARIPHDASEPAVFETARKQAKELEAQLKPHLLEAACEKARMPLTLRRQEGYDHSYFFIASFIADHLRWHAERLG